MDESRIRNKMFADKNESGYVWTGPYSIVLLLGKSPLLKLKSRKFSRRNPKIRVCNCFLLCF